MAGRWRHGVDTGSCRGWSQVIVFHWCHAAAEGARMQAACSTALSGQAEILLHVRVVRRWVSAHHDCVGCDVSPPDGSHLCAQHIGRAGCRSLVCFSRRAAVSSAISGACCDFACSMSGQLTTRCNGLSMFLHKSCTALIKHNELSRHPCVS